MRFGSVCVGRGFLGVSGEDESAECFTEARPACARESVAWDHLGLHAEAHHQILQLGLHLGAHRLELLLETRLPWWRWRQRRRRAWRQRRRRRKE